MTTPTTHMTSANTDDATNASPVEPLTDPESLREQPDVPFHEDTDVVDEETFETITDLDDMAPVGVTNDDGEVLVLRITETCRRKIPSAAVADGESFPTVAREWVEQHTGMTVELDGIEGVWVYEATLEGTDRTASRYFVVYSAHPVGETATEADANSEDLAAAIEWHTELPEEAAAVPGSALFFD